MFLLIVLIGVLSTLPLKAYEVITFGKTNWVAIDGGTQAGLGIGDEICFYRDEIRNICGTIESVRATLAGVRLHAPFGVKKLRIGDLAFPKNNSPFPITLPKIQNEVVYKTKPLGAANELSCPQPVAVRESLPASAPIITTNDRSIIISLLYLYSFRSPARYQNIGYVPGSTIGNPTYLEKGDNGNALSGWAIELNAPLASKRRLLFGLRLINFDRVTADRAGPVGYNGFVRNKQEGTSAGLWFDINPIDYELFLDLKLKPAIGLDLDWSRVEFIEFFKDDSTAITSLNSEFRSQLYVLSLRLLPSLYYHIKGGWGLTFSPLVTIPFYQSQKLSSETSQIEWEGYVQHEKNIGMILEFGLFYHI